MQAGDKEKAPPSSFYNNLKYFSLGVLFANVNKFSVLGFTIGVFAGISMDQDASISTPNVEEVYEYYKKKLSEK